MGLQWQPQSIIGWCDTQIGPPNHALTQHDHEDGGVILRMLIIGWNTWLWKQK
jgi:hypothetical protein